VTPNNVERLERNVAAMGANTVKSGSQHMTDNHVREGTVKLRLNRFSITDFWNVTVQSGRELPTIQRNSQPQTSRWNTEKIG
jgi:hypothetical protein